MHVDRHPLALGEQVGNAQRRELDDVRSEDDNTIREWVEAPGVRYVPVDGELELLPGLRLVPAPGRAKVRQGVVVSDKGEKTITVAIAVVKRHKRYHKILRSTVKLYAHDEVKNNIKHFYKQVIS